MISDPVFFDGEKFGFYHEDWYHSSTGFETEGQARRALAEYAKSLDESKSDQENLVLVLNM